jgi:hypothetical protein
VNSLQSNTSKHEEEVEALVFENKDQKIFMDLIPGHTVINKESFALTSIEMLYRAMPLQQLWVSWLREIPE